MDQRDDHLHPLRGSGPLGSNSSARRKPVGSGDQSFSIPVPRTDVLSQNVHHRTTRNQRYSLRDETEETIGLRDFSNDHRDIEYGSHIDGSETNTRSFDPSPNKRPTDTSSIRTEDTHVRRRDLGLLDVAALIINKQIGTGIFTTPGLVLSLTGNKTISMVLWVCGGIWALLSVIIYVEFGSAFPYNGGELIYLDEVFRVPELLPAILFSAFFLSVPNTNGNCMQFAKHVLLAALPNVKQTTELDKRLISFIAICILTVACAIHYFSRNSGLLLNLLFAGYKTVLLVAFIIAGAIASSTKGAGKSDWYTHETASRDVIAALIYIIYSYQGWENANYVGGELEIEKNALKWGAFLAVGVVTVLYTLVTLVYSLACPFDDLVGQDLGVVSYFAPMAFGDSGVTGIKICIALSAFGNLLAVVYTSSKVKQQIARQCFIPFFKFFGKDDKHFDTPLGALILHWVVTVIWILVTPNTSGGYGFVIGLFIYGQLLVGVFIAIAFFFIRRNYEADTSRNNISTGEPERWKPVILKNSFLRIFFGLVFLGMNLMVIIEGARSKEDPPAWLRPAVILSLLGAAIIYWGLLRIIAHYSNSKSPLEIRIVRDGYPVDNPKDEPVLRRAKMEGNSRVIIYELHGWLQKTFKTIDFVLHRIGKVIIR